NSAWHASSRHVRIRWWGEALEIVGTDGIVRTVRRGERAKFDLSTDNRKLITDHFPKTRKNSSGYALDRFAETGDEIDLLVGSEGTLAIVTAVHWRLDPIPPDVAGAAL